jgi:agmatine deiminase
LKRRTCMQATALGMVTLIFNHVSSAAALEGAAIAVVPGEEVPVERVWMGWPSTEEVWYDQLPDVQENIVRLVRTVAKYTPVNLVVNGPRQAATAAERIGSTPKLVTMLPNIVPDDMWLRDSGCVFRRSAQGGLECVKLNFNGWGGKQIHRHDTVVANQMAAHLGQPLITTQVVGEGGGVIQDGDGTLIANESSWVLKNRNPGKTRAQIEAELLLAYGAQKMIWLPGIVGQDITDAHIDATLQFFGPGKLVMQLPAHGADDEWAKEAHAALARLRRATDAKGRKFQFVLMDYPVNAKSTKTSLLRSYVNYLVLTDAVISVAFGDSVADAKAKANLQSMYPGRTVEMIRLDSIYAGGGGIHCVTQQQPAL